MHFFFSNFLTIGLCNSAINSLLDAILFLIASPEEDLSRIVKVSHQTSKADFLPKNLETIETIPL